jgi:hypothetical protein
MDSPEKFLFLASSSKQRNVVSLSAKSGASNLTGIQTHSSRIYSSLEKEANSSLEGRTHRCGTRWGLKCGDTSHATSLDTFWQNEKSAKNRKIPPSR